MIKKIRAFTTIELLLSLSLGSVIMLGVIQVYNTGVSYLEKSRDIRDIQRKVFLLFNQFDRDITSAFIPWFLEEVEPSSKALLGQQDIVQQNNKSVAPDDEQKRKERKNKKLKTFFVATVDANITKRIDDKKVQQLKEFSFISTGPLQVYAEKFPRIVRVKYELILDKQRSFKAKKCYSLIRKETLDIDDFKMAQIDFFGNNQKKKVPLRAHVIADGIKGIYCVFFGQKELKDKKQSEIILEETVSCVWGDDKSRSGVLPQRVAIYIDFWDSRMKQSFTFQTSIPIFSYSYPADNEEPFENKNNKGNSLVGAQKNNNSGNNLTDTSQLGITSNKVVAQNLGGVA